MKNFKNLKWGVLFFVATLSINCSSDDDEGGRTGGGGGDVFAVYSITIDGEEHNGNSPNSDNGTSLYTGANGTFAITLSMPNIPSGDEVFMFTAALPMDENNNPMPLGENSDVSKLMLFFNMGEPTAYGYESIGGSIEMENLTLTPIAGSGGNSQWANYKLIFSGTFMNPIDETTVEISGTIDVVGNY